MNIFDRTHRRFVSYIDKSREFYLNKGFNNPYRWASHEETPLRRLTKPLDEACIGLVTTAALNEEGGRDRQVYAAPTEPAPEFLHTHHLSWHKTATHTRDVNSFLPIGPMQKFVEEGRVGSLSPRFYGVPTKFSQRQTKNKHAPAILDFCRADKVDAALLVALWPVCHQTVSLTARHLEANGIPTVVIGSARDIVELCGVPRFLFTDFPLGNPCGKPNDVVMQHSIVGIALDMLETVNYPRTTVQSPFRWDESGEWRRTYMEIVPK